MPRAACTFIESSGGDAAGRRNLQSRRGAQPAEPVEIGALQHALFVHVSAQEARAVRLQSGEHFFGTEASRFAPAFDYDAALLGIERHDHTVFTDGRGKVREERRVDTSGGEGGRADDYLMRALVY